MTTAVINNTAATVHSTLYGLANHLASLDDQSGKVGEAMGQDGGIIRAKLQLIRYLDCFMKEDM